MTQKIISSDHQIEHCFFTAICQQQKHFGEAATPCISAYVTGIEAESFNPLYVKEENALLLNYLDEALLFLQKTGLPYGLEVRDELVPKLALTLRAKGFIQTGTTTAMSLDLHRYAAPVAPVNNKYTIQATNHKLETWFKPLTSAFEAPSEVGQQYLQRHQKAIENQGQLNHFTLFVESTPVCSLTLSCNDHSVRLDDIGTAKLHQGNGYARLLIAHALNYMHNLGKTCCYLEASREGLSLYEKIGFSTLFKFYSFVIE